MIIQTAPVRAEAAAETAATFVAQHGHAPLGVWSAPGRVNLIGEHVDYQGGLCLPFALPHRTFAAVGRRDDTETTISSVQAGESWRGDLTVADPHTLRFGTPGFVGYVGGVLLALGRNGLPLTGWDIVIDGRVPFGSGLSSSAALTCSVALAVAEIGGLDLDRTALAKACVWAENVVAGAATGGLDQAVSLMAQADHLLLLDCADDSRQQVPWRLGAEGWRLLAIDTRAPHELADGAYESRRRATEEAAAALGVGTLREARLDQVDGLPTALVPKARHVITEIARVQEAVAALEADDAARLGELMVASHVSLRDDFQVTVPELDTAVDTALAAGAVGARMTGGGFGGSIIALVADTAYDTVVAAVDAAFAEAGFAPPHLVPATPSAPAGRDL